MKAWVLLLVCACDQGSKPAPQPPPGPGVVQTREAEPRCVRRFKTFMQNCTGVPSQAGASQVEVCDECVDDSQCTAKAGGKCSEVGDNMCWGPRHLICKYPEARCGNQICPEPEHTLPPSSAPAPPPPQP